MKVSQFKELISKMVQEELKKQLPTMVESVLTERYLRHLVTEQVDAGVRNRSRSKLSEVLDENEDDMIPEPLANTQADMYTAGVRTRTETKKKSNKLLAPDNPMRGIYEGVEPLDERPVVPEVPIDRLGVDFNRMARLASVPSQRGSVPPASFLREQVQKATPVAPTHFDPRLDVPITEAHTMTLPSMPSSRRPMNPLLSRVMDVDDVEDPMEAAERELEARLRGVR
jgi:hypothetical protein